MPTKESSPENKARALFLENRYWRNMENAVANGIGKAFKK
ncbi:DUF6890 family protein [Dasania marina]